MREEKIHKIEVHVAGICIKEDKVLIVKRSSSRRLYPNFWECGGGQVEVGENFEEAVKRQLKEELGVIVEPIKILKVYEISIPDSEQKKIPGIKFFCEIIGFINERKPQITKEHSEWRWQPINQLEEIDFIPGIREDIKLAYSLYKEIK